MLILLTVTLTLSFAASAIMQTLGGNIVLIEEAIGAVFDVFRGLMRRGDWIVRVCL